MTLEGELTIAEHDERTGIYQEVSVGRQRITIDDLEYLGLPVQRQPISGGNVTGFGKVKLTIQPISEEDNRG